MSQLNVYPLKAIQANRYRQQRRRALATDSERLDVIEVQRPKFIYGLSTGLSR
jgi:hypothetical protein